MYLALYRKYRPKTFDEVIGQDKIIKTLKNQVIEDKIGHAYLFCGSRGTGKTSTAKIFARAINCVNVKDGNPCLECDVCHALSGENVDVFEIDAASNNGVDQIRDLREQIKYPPVNGRFKVYIIDEVHMLSTSAFNALLKTLEEPPRFVVFILATTEPHKLPATILSRCMRFDFGLVSIDCLANHLKRICDENNIIYDDEAIKMIARAGEGSVRDMLSEADRCIAYCSNKLDANSVANVLGVSNRKTLAQICQAIFDNDLGKALISLENVFETGKTPLVLSRDLNLYFIDLLFCFTVPKDVKNYVTVNDDDLKVMMNQANLTNYAKIVDSIKILSEIESELRLSVQPRVVLETALVRIITNQGLNSKIEELEEKMQNLEIMYKKAIKNTEFFSNELSDTAIIKKECGNDLKNNLSNQDHKDIANIDDKLNKAPINSFKENSHESEVRTGFNIDNVLGKLIELLKRANAMSLIAGLGQVKQVRANDKNVELIFDDDLSVEMIVTNRNKAVIDNYFNQKGFTCSFVSKLKASKTGVEINDLEKFLNGN